MSLNKNIIANYASQLYVTLAGIVMVPLYISYMGAEAYGLVGFFAMLQAWFNLLDMGLTPTIARETARFHGGALDAPSYRRLVRALEGVFFGVALFGGLLLFIGAASIATHWLNASQLPAEELTMALRLMAATVAMRWMCGLYRGVISGSERLVWLSSFNAGIATLRFVCILPVLIFLSASPMAFFSFQLGVAMLELIGLAWFAYRLLPIVDNRPIFWDLASIKPMLKFSLTIAFTSSVWILVTQTDKLLLSNILPLADYGYFTLAVLVASGITVMAGPISNAILPRMARLHAEGNDRELIALYRRATQLVAVVAMPAALLLSSFPREVLWAWTGDVDLVNKAAGVLRLYAVGYGVLVISAFPYYLQYAKGDLKLHLYGNIIFVCFLIPSVAWAATNYGAIGAGWAWLISNLLYFLLWIPLVHKRFAPQLHQDWLVNDVFRPLSLGCGVVFLGVVAIDWSDSRLLLSIELILFLVVVFLSCAVFASRVKVFEGVSGVFQKFFQIGC